MHHVHRHRRESRRERFHSGLVLLMLALGPPVAGAGDVFNTESYVPKGPTADLLERSGDRCRQYPLPSPLPLFDAIERSLCESPKTRGAWAMVKEAAANLGQGEAAYLPELEATGSYAAERDETQVSGPPGLQSNFSQPVNTESLVLGWVLYDFGIRAATLRGTKQLLLAAQANQNLVLQAALLNTAVDYYSAQAADAAVKSAQLIESDAQRTLDAATRRYDTGVAPVTDELQAKTAAAQAVFVRARAEGVYRSVIGKLAIDMSLAADEALRLPDLDQGALPDVDFVHAIHELMDTAAKTHPSVISARAQWQAALEDIRAVRAQGWPKLSLGGSLSRSDQPLSTNLGQPEFPGLSRVATIGINIEFPLFQGFGWAYKVRQAEATAEAQEQNVRDVEQQVELGVWSSFQILQTATENLRNTETVLQSARQSFNASERRYQSGVGGILELLTAQSALATAEQQRIQSHLDWRTARLQLAASLGQLGLWAIK